MKGVEIFVILAAVCISCCNAKNLPSFIQKCKRADPVPELGKCVIDRAMGLKPYLLKGIPELKLPPIEPLHIPKLEIHTRNSTAFAFDCIFTDIEIYGVKDFQVKELRIDWKKKEIFLHIYIPALRLQTAYEVNGKLLLFELASSGKGYGNITNAEAKALSPLVIETRNGKQYAILEEDPAPYISYENSGLYFENLFPNQDLTEQVNKALNDNFQQIAEEVNPLVYQSLRMLVYGIIKPIFSEQSLDELFD